LRKLLDHERAERRLAGRRHVERARVALGELQQLGKVFHAQRGIRDDDEALAADHGDMGEVHERIEPEIGSGGWREDMRAIAADHQGVAVGIGACDWEGVDHAAAASAVLDIELLLEGLRQLLGDEPSHAVGGAGGREWHDDFHWPVGPVLRLRVAA
jgi:hypothetical protein